jgi:hypothetical protein
MTVRKSLKIGKDSMSCNVELLNASTTPEIQLGPQSMRPGDALFAWFAGNQMVTLKTHQFGQSLLGAGVQPQKRN